MITYGGGHWPCEWSLYAGNCWPPPLERPRGLSKDIESAEHDVNLVAIEIKSTSDIVLLIKQSLDGSEKSKSDIVQKGITLLPDLTTQCEFCFERIRELIAFLEPYAPSKDVTPGPSQALMPQGARYGNIKFLSKLKWQKRRPQVQKVRGYLEGLKSNLHLLLSLLKHELAVEKQQPELMRSAALRSSTSARAETNHGTEASFEELQKAFEGVQVVPKTIDENIADDCATAAGQSPSGSQALISRRFMAARPQQAVQVLALQVLKPQHRGESASPDGVSPSDPMPHSSTNARLAPRKPSIRYHHDKRMISPTSPPQTSLREDIRRKSLTNTFPKDRSYAFPKYRGDHFYESDPDATTGDGSVGTSDLYGAPKQSFADPEYGLCGKDIGPNAVVPDDLKAHSGYNDVGDDSDYWERASTEAVICSVDQNFITNRKDIFDSGLRGKRRSLRKWAEDRDVEIIANLSDRTRSPSPG